MSEANPLWGAPRIHGELLKLGIDVSQSTVAKYMVRQRKPPSQTWRTFLDNHVTQLMAADFFVVPTATCRLLFVLVILAHDRRRVVHTAVTARPNAAWTPQQFREAFPWESIDADPGNPAWQLPVHANQIDRVELLELVQQMGRLSTDQREVLLLAAVEELRYEEIAEILAIPVGTVMSRLSRARHNLRQLVAGPASGLRVIK